MLKNTTALTPNWKLNVGSNNKAGLVPSTPDKEVVTRTENSTRIISDHCREIIS